MRRAACATCADVIAQTKERGGLVTVAADLLALTLLTSPGELGADVSVGSAQRFGVPLFGGGPHAAFMAVRTGLERMLPGRLVGVSIDADGARAYRLALQTREQHIRREKATSNICTAQALLAIVASMYAVYHGPDGPAGDRRARARARRRPGRAAHRHRRQVEHDTFFDTVRTVVPGKAREVVAQAAAAGVNLWAPDDDHVQIASDERTSADHLLRIVLAFAAAAARRPWTPTTTAPTPSGSRAPAPATRCPPDLRRTSAYLTHPVFHLHRSETAMLRYLRRLSDKDLALDRTMIPLGSCTMKLNATAEMEPISWPEFADHPPVRPHRPDPGLRGAGHGAAGLAGGDHRVRRGVGAAERGQPGRARRAARHPRATTRRAARSATSA